MQADDTRENLTRRANSLCLALLLVTCSSVDVTAAEIYSWTDENGIVHYSDTPPANGEMATLEVEEIYRPGTADTTATPADEPEADFCGQSGRGTGRSAVRCGTAPRETRRRTSRASSKRSGNGATLRSPPAASRTDGAGPPGVLHRRPRESRSAWTTTSGWR